jgi:hypothetical protein
MRWRDITLPGRCRSPFGDHTQINGAQVMQNARDHVRSDAIATGHANYPMGAEFSIRSRNWSPSVGWCP